MKKFDDIVFASILVHEADHVEYHKSDNLRKQALYIHCQPLLNPNISINSDLPDLEHRFSVKEVCAEIEENAFLKKAGYSRFSFKNGLIYELFIIISQTFKNIFYIIKYSF